MLSANLERSLPRDIRNSINLVLPETNRLKPIRFLPGLFVVAFAFEIGKEAFSIFWFRLVEESNLIRLTPSPISLQMLQFTESLISFAISPCLLFCALYILGKKLSLGEDLWSPVTSLFLGGAIGEFFGIFLAGLNFIPLSLSTYFSFLQAEFGNAWVVGLLVLSSLGDGIFAVFVGISAIVIGAYRRKRVAANLGEPSPAQDSLAGLKPTANADSQELNSAKFERHCALTELITKTRQQHRDDDFTTDAALERYAAHPRRHTMTPSASRK